MHIICRDNSKLSSETAAQIEKELIDKGIRVAAHFSNDDGSSFQEAIIRGIPIQIIIDNELAGIGSVEVFDRRSLAITQRPISSGLAAEIRRKLSRGDALLLREQKIKRNIFTEQLNSDSVASMPCVSKKHCFRVSVHEDQRCIDILQSLGHGEYIGTDLLENDNLGRTCFSCGQPCMTIGCVSKRL